jgi:alpha-glucosidase
MQWDAGPNAGFTPAGVTPWLPVADDYKARNVAVQEEDPTSILTLYRRLTALRRATPALHGGGYRPVDGVPQDSFVYWREEGDERLLIALNFSAVPKQISLPEARHGQVVLSTHLDREGPTGGAVLDLRPNEGLILTF